MLLSVAADRPAWSTNTCLYPSSSGWTTYTPTITVSGGTVPTYTAINSGRWRQVGNVIHVRIVLTNSSGGTAGAGANAIVVALPTARGASGSSIAIQQVGYALNNATYYLLRGSFAASGSTLTLQYYNALTTTTNLTGALQNNAVRELHLAFCYER
jgi:predicted RecA/RadA family phage recombinase